MTEKRVYLVDDEEAIRRSAAFMLRTSGHQVETYASGEINAIYERWFMQPIPPKGLNMNFPMSDELKNLIANPTDKAADEE